ncbi:MAG TPA: hypothetical protein VGK35_06610, partial [Actinotalea sp.]
MASTRRKSAAIALAVIGVAGLTLASAAQLNLTPTSLGAGSTVVASCDDTVGVGYTTAYASTGYDVSAVNLTGVAALCNGLSYKVTLLTGAVGSQTPIGSEATGTLTVTGTTATIAVTPV